MSGELSNEAKRKLWRWSRAKQQWEPLPMKPADTDGSASPQPKNVGASIRQQLQSLCSGYDMKTAVRNLLEALHSPFMQIDFDSVEVEKDVVTFSAEILVPPTVIFSHTVDLGLEDSIGTSGCPDADSPTGPVALSSSNAPSGSTTLTSAKRSPSLPNDLPGPPQTKPGD